MDKTAALIVSITILIFGGILIYALTAAGTGSNSASSSKLIKYSVSDKERPKMEMPETHYSFGKIPKNPPAAHDFVIKNVGSKPLQITEIRSSCDCTSAILKIPGQKDSPRFSMHTIGQWIGEIPPNTIATLQVIYDPTVMPEIGMVYRAVYFKTNDPENSEGKVDINMEVE